jgi:hypothetical protein
MIGEQVPSLLIEAQTIKTSRPSDEEWESHKESIGRLYIDESSSTAVDIAMTWESVQEQHVQKEGEETVCSNFKPKNPPMRMN